MALIEGGDIGFDEGGILQALSHALHTKTTVTYTYDRKDRIKTQTTDVTAVSVADVLAVLVVAGVITLTGFAAARVGEVTEGKALGDTFKDIIWPF